jgi:transglycosylase-like protein with SLT domain
MENKHESSAPQSKSRTGLHLRSRVKTLYTSAFGTVLAVLSIVGLQVFRATPKVIPAAAAAPAAPALAPASGASRHSTLSFEVFQKYVNRNHQRMYPRLSREIVDAAVRYSDKYDLSPILVLAVAETESEFYPFAVSKQNAKGLMQINPDVNFRLLVQEGIIKEPADLFDPDRNIEAGCFLLRRFINESPDFNTALDKYLGANSVTYKADIHQVMGKVLLLGITEELNETSAHKIQPIVKVEASSKETKGLVKPDKQAVLAMEVHPPGF